MRSPSRATAAPARGFTLAEVAVTIALVGLALVWMMQALQTAKLSAAYTRNVRLARELGLLTLGQIEAGLFRDDVIGDRLVGTYANEGYPEFAFEAVFGDETFLERTDDGEGFDNWRWERRQREEEEDEEAEQPYERVQVKVLFPQIQDYKSELLLERWLPWDQMHPPEEGEEGETSSAPGGPP